MSANSTHSAIYPAHAFHDSLPNGRAAGELSIDHTGLRFDCEARSVTVPFAGAQLTLGGASNRLVFISHPALPEWSIYTSERSLLRDPRVLQHPELGQAVGRIRGAGRRKLAITLALLLLLLALPAVLLLNLDVLTRVAARQVPLAWEEQLGKLAISQVRLGTVMIEDNEAAKLLDQLTHQLTAALPNSNYKFHFYIARDATLNAFALPGGYVVVHSELLLRAESAEELLGVLAHEISHVTEQHSTRNLLASAGLALTLQLLIGDASGVLGTLISAAPFLLTQKYSRGFEREADRTGYQLLLRADVNPSGLLSFFEKLKAEEAKLRRQGGKVGDALNQLPEFMSTHPTTDSRIADLRHMVAAHNGAYHDFGETFAALKARVQTAQTAAPQQPTQEKPDEDAN